METSTNCLDRTVEKGLDLCNDKENKSGSYLCNWVRENKLCPKGYK